MKNGILGATAILAIGGLTLAMAASFPDPPKSTAPAQTTTSAVLAGGCFWGMQGIFEHMKGVTNTVVGYAGGKKETARYERVEDGDTGHAESIKITYDPSKISYGDLLKVYFSAAHDPTTLNRQHYDQGTQYRSAIFYADDEQKKEAEAYIKELNDANVAKSMHWDGNKIVTQVVPLTGFYPAEAYHQHYLDLVAACDANPKPQCGSLNAGYIHSLDVPLLKRFQSEYPDLYVKESR
ncbi:MAG TPA: peptide-methionine (S)-S-oxide reductase MsrA [Bryobacteraceae bacterium]|nr:peptide-methionine (S)-S-oxide reductase MsrA [Bryobacteraceae bacterium]